MKPLRIAYLIEDTQIAGGTRVALAQADGLIARGHQVSIVTKDEPPAWRSSAAEWLRIGSFDIFDATGFDFVIGTFWTTLAGTYSAAGGRGVHLCQGYEGSFTGYRDLKPLIDAAYRLALPKITVSPHLVDVCRTFYDDATYIGQIVDDLFFQPAQFREASPLRVLLVGPWQADFKGIETGYEAVREARAAGASFDLVRASQWEPAAGEPKELAVEFHVAIDSQEMARLIASCDIALAPSRHEEGFGLPAAEAMAGGLAAVVSAIPSFLSFDDSRDYALFAAENDGPGMGQQLERLVRDVPLRRRIARRGREVAEQFRAARTCARLEEWFLSRRQA